MRTNDHAHATGFGDKPRVLEHPADEERGFFGCRVQPDQSVGGMAEFAFEEVFVAREEGGLLQAVQGTIRLSSAMLNRAMSWPTTRQRIPQARSRSR